MEIKQLAYFMAVAREESFSRAAEKLSVSQPTLSVAVKKLEEELGVPLFFTLGRRQKLTDEGKKLFEGGTHLLDQYCRTVEEVKAAESSDAGEFTLGLAPLFGTCFFGELIPNFLESYPRIKVHMIEQGANRLERLLASGEIDLAVTLQSRRALPLTSCHFSTQKNVAVLHRNHPLARAEHITLADLKGDSFAIFSEEFLLHEQIMQTCKAAGFSPKIALLSSQWDFMVEIVARGHGVSILPKPIMDRHPSPEVCCVPLRDSMRYWEIELLWNQQKYMPKSCRIFLEYLKRHLPKDDL